MMLILKRLFFMTMVLCFSLTIWANSAQASIKINNQFEATSSCPALQSIRRRTNPGNITIVPGTAYQATEKNKPDATYYRLEIDGANPSLRWVAVNCGELLGAIGDDGGENPVPENPEYLLAISWQPAFCETRPNKKECRTQTVTRFDAENFTLHGLWPQPRGNAYCGVSKRNKQLDKEGEWSQLPPIDLSDELFEELAIKMPGVASFLHRHEWYKHGTCYNTTPEEYFRESLVLLDQVNNSVVQDLFANNIGQKITDDQIGEQLVQAFGDGVDNKVQIRCKTDEQPRNRRMITELWLNLEGTIESDTQIEDLFKNAPIASSRCSLAEVDKVGLK